MGSEKKLWGGRFSEDPEKGFVAFNRSLGFDKRLFEADVRASIAHCRGLEGAGVLTDDESRTICSGLETLLANVKADPSLLENAAAEDIHSLIEQRLVDLVGEAGLKLHTGRSRNDQVAVAFRIWVRDACSEVDQMTRKLQEALLSIAREHKPTVMPGYTHLQRAQPVLLAHWCLAYFEMFRRDRDRLEDCRTRLNVSPLGSAALAGTSYAIDRKRVADELGFDGITRNSLDAVSDRDFCAEFAFCASLLMTHLSRMAEDIILFCTSEFGIFSLSDRVATGSSIMPQKKNPDSMELVRGKSGRVFGSLVGLLTVLKGLPLAYNKDLQEDKESVFDTFDTVAGCLRTTVTVLENMSVDVDAARAACSAGYLTATELADYLAKKGLPFRQAHEVTGAIVLKAEELGVELEEMPIATLREFSPLIGEDVFGALTLGSALESKSVPGGTSPSRVAEAIEEASRYLENGG